jgi:two-component sensor histidine kinase
VLTQRTAPIAPPRWSKAPRYSSTNAIKFGARSQPQSQLRVLWWFQGSAASHLHFEWAEKNVRMAAMNNYNPGFGSRVVKRLNRA